MRADETGPRRWLLARGTAAVLGAVLANAAVLRAGTQFTRLPPMYRPDAIGPVVVPAAAAVCSAALYANLDGRERRYRAFLRLLGVGLLVSFVPILVAASVLPLSPTGVAVLAAQHVTVAAVIGAAFVPERPWTGGRL